ncbi:MAG TPA: M28 family peptidase [Candidatus Lokiarchaeia archaeon]|nr:M28 family peptidase [Candidatus Lokiarchaeia archaeon]
MPIEVSEDDADYMEHWITRVCTEVGPGGPGTPQERSRAMMAKDELEQYSDDVVVEDFTLSPRAFLGWIRVTICALALSMLFFYLIPVNPILFAILAVVMVALGFLIMWEEFFNYAEFLDPVFKKKTSENIIGTLKSSDGGEPKKILIFSGHHDSAFQFNLLKWFKYGYFVITFVGIGSLFIYFALTVVRFVGILAGADQLWVVMVVNGLLYVVIPVMILLFFFQGTQKNGGQVPGAIDNLSAVAIVLGVGRILKRAREQGANIVPEGIEIRFISFGSEEAGLRGAYRYAARHEEELHAKDAEIFNLDTICDPNVQTIIKREDTTRTIHSTELIAKMARAAQVSGVRCNVIAGPFISGGTDATPFSKKRIKAISLVSVPIWKFPTFYHQPADNPAMINKKSLQDALKLAIAYIQLS